MSKQQLIPGTEPVIPVDVLEALEALDDAVEASKRASRAVVMLKGVATQRMREHGIESADIVRTSGRRIAAVLDLPEITLKLKCLGSVDADE